MNFSIGDICFAVDDTLATLQQAHVLSFVSTKSPDAFCSLTTDVIPVGSCLFHSGLNWRLHQTEDGFALCMHRGDTEDVYQMGGLSRDFTEMWLTSAARSSDSVSFFSLDGGLFQLWANFLLLGSRGILVHGLGVKRNGLAHLFIGPSGAGKSTLGHLLAGAGKGVVLSDDRIVLRPNGSDFRAYGTPWNGETQFHLADDAPLEALYFLEQASACFVTPLSHGEAAARLFAASFIAGWPVIDAVQYVLGFAGNVASRIPCYRFGFTPDERALEMLGWQ